MTPIATVNPGLMLLLGVVLLVLILLRRSYRYFGRRRRRDSHKALVRIPRPTDPFSGIQPDSEAQLARREIELHELYRQLTARLDSKIIVLQHLVSQSERAAERLQGLLDRNPLDGAVSESLDES